MSKILKVSDKTHELVMSLRGEGESVDDVIASRLQAEVETPMEKVLREVYAFKSFLTKLQQDAEKNTSEATPQKERKTAGGGRPPADVFGSPISPDDPEMSCCKVTNGKQPCKHWRWNGNEMKWVNDLSNRIIEPSV